MKNGILKCITVSVAVLTVFTSNLWATEMNKGLVKENTVALTEPSQDAQAAVYLKAGEELVVVEEADDYYGILIENKELVYILKDQLVVQGQLANAEIKEEKMQEIAAVNQGQQVVNFAKQFIGLPYRSGGSNLKTGVDCSGFTQQIYANFNVKLQRSSRDQYASNGRKVTRAELVPGDLVFYGVNGNVRHVAIYVGNDQIIHAPVPGKSVCIVPIQQRGDDPIIGYKRIFE